MTDKVWNTYETFIVICVLSLVALSFVRWIATDIIDMVAELREHFDTRHERAEEKARKKRAS